MLFLEQASPPSTTEIRSSNALTQTGMIDASPCAPLVSVFNEWDPVEEMIVGSALYAGLPHEDKGFEVIQQSTNDLFDSLSAGAYPQKIIEETEEDIQNFIA